MLRSLLVGSLLSLPAAAQGLDIRWLDVVAVGRDGDAPPARPAAGERPQPGPPPAVPAGAPYRASGEAVTALDASGGELWTTILPTGTPLKRPGVLLMSPAQPGRAAKATIRLAPAEDHVYALAGVGAPLVRIARETGAIVHKVERPWEIQRSFTGPSMWSHQMGRAKPVETKNPRNQRVGFIVDGPLYSSAHGGRVYLVVADGPQGFTRELATARILEFSKSLRPIAELPLPTNVVPGTGRAVGTDILWSLTDGGVMRVQSSPESARFHMGPGGPDCRMRIQWLLRAQDPEALFGKASMLVPQARPQAQDRKGNVWLAGTHARLQKADSSELLLPLSVIDIESGRTFGGAIRLPFDGKLARPETNYSNFNGTLTSLAAWGGGIESMKIDGGTLRVTLFANSGKQRQRREFAFVLDELRAVFGG